MKTKVNLLVLCMSLIIIMCSCENDYINKKNYHLKVGEKFEIYYTSNSCCGRCWNIETVENIEFIKNRTIEESDVPGATNDYAILFQAVKEGVDTLKTHHYAMSDSCNLNSQESDIYLIQVSK